MLHVRCGDDILEALRRSGLPGTVSRWIDPLCEGPTPAGLDAATFRAVRAAWSARRYGLDEAALLRTLADQDAALESAAASAEEVVLWVERDLFDQTVLVHLLDRLEPLASGRLSLTQVDHFAPDPRQLATLFPTRRRVGPNQAARAGRAWRALSAATPEALNALADEPEGREPSAPFPLRALDRFRRQYPWRGHNLSLTEWRVLEAVAAGAASPRAIFQHIQAREAAPWQAEAMLVAVPRDLAGGPEPLLSDALTLTGAGRAVLEGRAVAAPRDRRIGGVDLGPKRPDWRWDDGARRIVLL